MWQILCDEDGFPNEEAKIEAHFMSRIDQCLIERCG